MYVATEGAPYDTWSTRRVSVTGGRVQGRETPDRDIDHGAVLVLAGRAGTTVTDTTLRGLRIGGTRPGASAAVGLRADRGRVERTELDGLVVRDAPRLRQRTATSPWAARAWLVDGALFSDAG